MLTEGMRKDVAKAKAALAIVRSYNNLEKNQKQINDILKSGELEEFFEITGDYIIYDDNFASQDDAQESEIIFTNDDYGIEIDEFDMDEFLEIFCKGAKTVPAATSNLSPK